MHKMQVFMACMGLLLALVVVGCGDDEECPSCPAPANLPGFTQGFTVLTDGSTMMRLEILGTGSGLMTPDSARVGDSLVPKSDWEFGYAYDLTDFHFIISFQEGGVPATFMYDHGDTATLTVWGEGRSSTCRIKILDYSLAQAVITAPADDADTIAPGAADTIFWHKVEQVDYYACLVAYGLAWESLPRVDYFYTTDTSFVLTGAMYDSLATAVEVYINPFNGPDPRTGRTNWTGNLLGGVVYSTGQYDMTRIHVLQPAKSARPAPTETAGILPEIQSEDIVSGLYKQYGYKLVQ